MDFDPADHLGATARVVEDRVHDGRPARVVIATRTYDTTREDLWDALTNPERLPRWFLPISGDLRLGGRYQLEGNAGGEITRCDPPERLDVTWEFGGDVSWVHVALSELPESRTRLQLEHIAHPGDHWKQFGPGAVGIGWELGLMGLALHIASGADRAAFDESAWTQSEEGKSFMRGSGEAWIAADIAGGTDTTDASQRGRNTIAFYLGEHPTDPPSTA